MAKEGRKWGGLGWGGGDSARRAPRVVLLGLLVVWIWGGRDLWLVDSMVDFM